MHPGVQAWFARQHGLIRRAQALDLGVAPGTIRLLLRSGSWVVAHHGVYAVREAWDALDEHRGRPLLRARAALMVMKRDGVLSHDSAAHALGMDILRPDQPYVHVTRPGLTNAWTKAGVKHHLARFRVEQVVVTPSGLPALDLARTAVDIARERGDRHGLVAFDSAMRMGVAREAFDEALAIMDNWPGSSAARRCRDLADPGAESVAESLGRELVVELGIGDPDTQFPVRTTDGVKWGDIRVGNHLFEVDGLIKLLGVREGGVAEQKPAEVIYEEKRRERLLRGRNLGVSRILWEDYWGNARVRARERLRAEYLVSEQRFGAELHPDLAREAEEIRRNRPRRQRIA